MPFSQNVCSPVDWLAYLNLSALFWKKSNYKYWFHLRSCHPMTRNVLYLPLKVGNSPFTFILQYISFSNLQRHFSFIGGRRIWCCSKGSESLPFSINASFHCHWCLRAGKRSKKNLWIPLMEQILADFQILHRKKHLPFGWGLSSRTKTNSRCIWTAYEVTKFDNEGALNQSLN